MKNDSPKSIAFVLDEMYVGGTEKSLIELLNAIDYSKYKITLFLKNTSGALQHLVNPKVSVRCWYTTDSQTALINHVKKLEFVRAFEGLYYRCLARMHRNDWVLNAHYATMCIPAVGKEKFDCVVAYQYCSPSVVAMALHNIPGKKKALFVHGKANRAPKLFPFLDKVYSEFDRIFCVSEDARIEFIRCFPVSGKKTSVMYNLLDDRNIYIQAQETIDVSFNPDCLNIVTVGRLSPEKGQDLIPHIARLLLDASCHFCWYLIGDGILCDSIERDIEELNLSDHVILLGTKENPYPYMYNCDLYVQTSKAEGWGLTVQEARILRKPVIVPPLPVMHEQITHGKTGIITKDFSPDAFCSAIQELAYSQELRANIQKNLGQDRPDNLNEINKLYAFIN